MFARVLLFSLVLGLVPACQTQVQGVDAVLVTAPTYEARFDKALEKLAIVRLSLDGAKLITDAGDGAASDRPDLLGGLADPSKVKSIMGDAAVRSALLGLDEGAAVAALTAKGVKLLVVHSAVAPSLDRTRQVLSRLYNHDQLSVFSLVRVGEGLLYYEIPEKPVTFAPQLAGLSISYLRHRLSGKPPVRLPEARSENGRFTFIATIRAKSGGTEQAIAIGQDGNFQRALEELVADLEVNDRRNVEIYGFPPLSERIDDVNIEIQRVVERATVEPRDEATMETLFELGVDGAYMLTEDKKERGVLPGSVAYTRSINTADDFLRRAAASGKMSEKRPWRDPAATLEILRTVHYREILGKGIMPMYRGYPVISEDSVTLDTVRNGVLLAGNWWLANLAQNGQVTYKMWPSENRYSDEYNHVRHTLATWNLVQAYTLDPRPEYLEGAKRALSWTNQYRVDDGEMSLYRFDNNQKLGSAVVGLLGIVDLAVVTKDHQYDDLMQRLGRFTKSMQLENGKFDGYLVPKGHPYYGQTNDIVPGEAALSLVRLAEYFDDNSWIDGLPRFWTYYQPWFRERVAKGSQESPWPAYRYDNDTRLELVQFGPWTVMAANAYNRRTGDMEVAKFGLEIARWMIEAYEYTDERAPYPDYIGGYYKMDTELPAMQAFCYAEGTAAAYQLALRMAPDEAPFFEKATRESVRFGLNMQYNEQSVYPFTRVPETLGGVRYAMNETKVRVDYTYHAQSSMYQWYLAALTDPAQSEKVRGDHAVIPQPTGPASGLVPFTVPTEAPPPLVVKLAVQPGVGGRPPMINADPTRPLPPITASGSAGDDGGE